MARGFLSGAIWGTVLSVGGLGALSVMAPDRDLPPVEMPEVATPSDAPTKAAATPTETAPDTTEVVAAEPADEADTTVADVTQPEAETEEPAEAAPQSDATENSEDASVTPEVAEPVASEPEADSTKDNTAEVPMTDSATTGLRPADVTPVSPDAALPMLDAPAAPENPVPAETAAAPLPTPETGEAIGAMAAPDVSSAPVAPSSPASESSPGGTSAPALSVPESETGLSVSTEPAQPPAPAVPAVQTPLAPADEAPEAIAQPESAAPEAAAEAETPTAERPPVRRLIQAEPEAAPADTGSTTAALRPSIGTPAGSLTERNGGTPNRLPSIGADADDASQTETPSVDTESNLSPLQRYAASVDSDPALPKMSIVMIDDGNGPLGPDTLEGFPFPVTFALDPTQPGAAERMAAYRALGYEVATLVNLPASAQPTDVEQILGGAIAAVPEAVALIEAPGGGLQADRTVTEQAASFAADSGHGLVFLPNGLNTAQAIALREDVPALSILRDFDGEGQDARTKRRFLDGAAFRARQDGAVVMLGRLTPDTLSSLVLWSLQDRASSVAMVPVSALLLNQSN